MLRRDCCQCEVGGNEALVEADGLVRKWVVKKWVVKKWVGQKMEWSKNGVVKKLGVWSDWGSDEQGRRRHHSAPNQSL